MRSDSVLGWSGAIVGDRQTTFYGRYRGRRRGLAVVVSDRGEVRLVHPRFLFGSAARVMLDKAKRWWDAKGGDDA